MRVRFELSFHYSDVTWASWHFKSLATRLSVQRIILVNVKETIKGQYYWPFVRGMYQWIHQWLFISALQWHHNGLDGISNHQPHHCLLSRLFRRRSKKISKLRVIGLCQCSKLLPVRQPKADNFGGGPGTFLKLFFNFMSMIWAPFVQGIQRWPVNSPHKWPVTRKMFPFHGVIMAFPTQRASDAGLWLCLCCLPDVVLEQTV